jgi:beta-glucanase (GH16 family)
MSAPPSAPRARLTSGARAAALAAALLAACARAPEPAERAAGDASPSPAVEPLFADEFSGAAIDRAKWEVYTGPVWNAEVQEYVDDTASVYLTRGPEADGAEDGSVLVLRARHRPRGAEGRDFTSGRLHGRTLFRFGTVAARMRLPTGAGLWPAFWLLGGGEWPDTGELDIMENVGDSSWVNAAIHGPGYSGDTPLVRRDTLPAGRDVTGWHVYAAAWTADSVVFSVDGAPFYRVTRAEIERHGAPTALDSAKYVVLNLALGGGYPAAVNGVKAPYLGLPESTVRRIRAGEARVIVDWVRATR